MAGRDCGAPAKATMGPMVPMRRLLAVTLTPAIKVHPMLACIRDSAGGGDLGFMAAGGTDPEVSGGSDPPGAGKKQRECGRSEAGGARFSDGDARRRLRLPDRVSLLYATLTKNEGRLPSQVSGPYSVVLPRTMATGRRPTLLA